jgi:type I restriction enzyme S subunit
MFLAKSNAGHKLCQPNDLAINTMWAWMGALGISPYAGIVSPSYGVYRVRDPEALLPTFLHHLLRTPAYVAEYTIRSSGIHSSRLRLYPQQLLRIPIPRPPVEEQLAIVRFLDHANRQFDRAIRAKRKLIALLNEQKQAIIHRAVTRGLDPNVPMKDSGVPWLGEVPGHWDVVALRHRYSQCLGKMLDSTRITGTYPVPYLRNTDVQWDSINHDSLPVMDIKPAEYERYLVKPGDLLVCEGGEVGRCAIWTGDLAVCGFQKALHRLRPLDESRDLPRFAFYVLRAGAKNGAFDDGHVSTIQHLTGDKLRAHRFAFPPGREQEYIVDKLDEETGRIDALIERVRREITLLVEYRTRLTSDVVTGQLDVREAALTLPALEPDAAPSALDDDPDLIEDVADELEEAAS